MLPLVGGPEPERTRAQALATAESVYRELSKDPARFDEFVLKFSEHPDAARKGDFGAWSTREVTKLAREVALLLELDIGEIAPPLDSPEGFEIIQRTAPGPRQRYAAEVVALGFSRDAADSEPNSRASVFEAARGLLEQVQRDPSEFDALRTRYCCAQVMDWYEGQDEPGRVTDVVAGLELGQIAAVPVESFNNIVLPRRVDPARAAARPSVELELPAPEHIDMVDLLRRSADSAGFVVDEFGQVAEKFFAEMRAGADERAQLAALVAELDRTVERDSRIQQYRRLLGHIPRSVRARGSYALPRHAAGSLRRNVLARDGLARLTALCAPNPPSPARQRWPATFSAGLATADAAATGSRSASAPFVAAARSGRTASSSPSTRPSWRWRSATPSTSPSSCLTPPNSERRMKRRRYR